jgi:HSP20 family molecular chaperone IbpA
VYRVLEDFGGYLWDPFRGFEWPVEYELPTRIPYVDVVDSGTEYVVKAELLGLKTENVQIGVWANELSLTAKSEVEKEEQGKNLFAQGKSTLNVPQTHMLRRKYRYRKSVSKHG